MEIQEILCSKLPIELVNKILYENNGLVHPIAKILKKIIEECKEYIYHDSGGWEEKFITFSTYYDGLTKGRYIKSNSLKLYIFEIDSWYGSDY